MTRLLAALAIVVLVSSSARAQVPSASDQLRAARTAFLVNAGGYHGTFEDLATALVQWGRWTLVDDPKAADLTITLGGLAVGRGWPITITSTAAPHALLWQDRQKKELWSRGAWKGGVAGAFVHHLRQQLEAPSQ